MYVIQNISYISAYTMTQESCEVKKRDVMYDYKMLKSKDMTGNGVK